MQVLLITPTSADCSWQVATFGADRRCVHHVLLGEAGCSWQHVFELTEAKSRKPMKDSTQNERHGRERHLDAVVAASTETAALEPQRKSTGNLRVPTESS